MKDYSLNSYDCSDCKDTGYIIKDWEGAGLAYECKCQEQKRIQKRVEFAMIPDEFEEATFESYRITDETQKRLYDAAMSYIKDFDLLKDSKLNSLGFIASVGEQRLKELSPEEQHRNHNKYNSYGLGKTHLQVAIAKELIKQGHRVLIVSDVVLMDELMSHRRDDMQEYHKLIDTVTTVPVLVWDDIGESNPTEAKLKTYNLIINERFKRRLPILYSSNEDVMNLGSRIGGKAASRLLGMSRERICQVSGLDYRILGAV